MVTGALVATAHHTVVTGASAQWYMLMVTAAHSGTSTGTKAPFWGLLGYLVLVLFQRFLVVFG